jgi:dCTP diphosphatase
VREELADIFLYTLRLSQKLDIDLIAAANEKMESNALKYPSDKVRGSAKKYNEYE